jgi:isoquinoline 1-oxidoreductase alpha subunit
MIFYDLDLIYGRQNTKCDTLLASGATMKINVNGQDLMVNLDGDTPMLWVIRDELNYTGTKFGCGKALCGACTIHVDGEPTRSCSFPLSAAVGKQITTIEGLKETDKVACAVKNSWCENSVPQCGYCQSGQIMSAIALLREKPKPTDTDIDQAMAGNICRCGTYQRVRHAIHEAAQKVKV